MHLGFFIDVNEMSVLVIGGGKVAKRKTNKLLKAGAQVTAISPVFNPTFPQDAIRIVKAVDSVNFTQYIHDIKPQLIILATPDVELHQALIKIAKQHSIFINDSQDGYTQFAFANTTSAGKSLISYFSHGDMNATRHLKRHVSSFIKQLDSDNND